MEIQNLLVALKQTVDGSTKHWQHDWVPHDIVSIFFGYCESIVSLNFFRFLVDNLGANDEDE
jgi:hypothetical protein